MPSSTRAWASRRVSALKRSGRSVSRLTVTRPRPAAAQRRRVLGEQDAVGGHGEVGEPGSAASIATSRGRSLRSSGSPPVRRTLSTPEVDEDVDEPADLLEREDVLPGQPDVLLLRHAVVAAQVAAVGDGEPQVPERTAERSSTEVTAGSVTAGRRRSRRCSTVTGKQGTRTAGLLALAPLVDVPAPAVPGAGDERAVEIALARADRPGAGSHCRRRRRRRPR